jgi:hypothetical protein
MIDVGIADTYIHTGRSFQRPKTFHGDFFDVTVL